jgi:hypothetical protein
MIKTGLQLCVRLQNSLISRVMRNVLNFTNNRYDIINFNPYPLRTLFGCVYLDIFKIIQ